MTSYQTIIPFISTDTTTTDIYTLSYTTLFRSIWAVVQPRMARAYRSTGVSGSPTPSTIRPSSQGAASPARVARSEEHTSELQSRRDLVCRLLLEKKKI